MFRRYLGVLLCCALLLSATPKAEACLWSYYTGFNPASPERRKVDQAVAAKDWKQLEKLLTAQEELAAKHEKANQAVEGQGWHWEFEQVLQYQWATLHFAKKNLDAAKAAIDRALLAHRRNREGPNFARDSAGKLSGFVLKRKQKHELRAQILLLYGNIELARGNVKQAISRLKSAAAAKPKDPRFHASLGTAYERAGKYKLAERSLSRAIRLSPKHHGGMEWVHLEVVRFRQQLKRAPKSASTRPFLYKFRGKKSEKELMAARKFAASIAPDLPSLSAEQ